MRPHFRHNHRLIFNSTSSYPVISKCRKATERSNIVRDMHLPSLQLTVQCCTCSEFCEYNKTIICVNTYFIIKWHSLIIHIRYIIYNIRQYHIIIHHNSYSFLITHAICQHKELKVWCGEDSPKRRFSHTVSQHALLAATNLACMIQSATYFRFLVSQLTNERLSVDKLCRLWSARYLSPPWSESLYNSMPSFLLILCILRLQRKLCREASCHH